MCVCVSERESETDRQDKEPDSRLGLRGSMGYSEWTMTNTVESCTTDTNMDQADTMPVCVREVGGGPGGGGSERGEEGGRETRRESESQRQTTEGEPEAPTSRGHAGYLD